ncbi:MAG: HAD hydrolase-like protein [Patescibacteria group bacterium]
MRTLLLFDWNGTLIDDCRILYQYGVCPIFEHYGLPAPILDEWRNEVSSNFMPFYEKYGVVGATAEELNRIMVEGLVRVGVEPPLFPDTRGMIEVLYRSGANHVLAIVSGYQKAALSQALLTHDIARFFHEVHGNVRDKAPLIRDFMARYGIPPERTVYIGDTADDAIAAHAAGVTPYICPRGFHGKERIEAIRSVVPTLVVIETLSELLTRLPERVGTIV